MENITWYCYRQYAPWTYSDFKADCLFHCAKTFFTNLNMVMNSQVIWCKCAATDPEAAKTPDNLGSCLNISDTKMPRPDIWHVKSIMSSWNARANTGCPTSVFWYICLNVFIVVMAVAVCKISTKPLPAVDCIGRRNSQVWLFSVLFISAVYRHWNGCYKVFTFSGHNLSAAYICVWCTLQYIGCFEMSHDAYQYGTHHMSCHRNRPDWTKVLELRNIVLPYMWLWRDISFN